MAIITNLKIGAGGINYVADNDFESGLGNWLTYYDGPAAAPVDGIGGTVPSSFTATIDSTGRLRESRALKISKKSVGGAQGAGLSYDFTVSNADLAKVMTVSFEYTIIGADAVNGYRDGDLVVYIIENPSGTPRVIQPTGFQVRRLATGLTGKHVATFQTSSTVTSYRICIHLASTLTTTQSFDMVVDSVSVGPQTVQYGAPITDWQSYTPSTQGFGTPTNMNVYWRRVGGDIQIRGSFTAGTVTAVGARVNFPPGLVSTTDAVADTIIGTYGRGNSNYQKGGLVLKQNGLAFVGFGPADTFGDSTNASLSTQLATNVVSSSEKLSFEFFCPIAGWSSTVQMSNDTDTRVIAARYRSTTTQALSASVAALISTPSAVFDTHGSFNTSTNRFTCPVPGYYRISAKAAYISTAASAALLTFERNGVGQETFSGFQSGAGEQFRLHGSILVLCNAGDTLGVQAFSGNATTLNTSGETSFVEFERLSGPSAIAASETVAARFTGIPTGTTAGTFAAAGAVTYPTKTFDTHGMVSGSNINIPVAGKYKLYAKLQISCTTSGNDGFAGLAVYVDGVIYSTHLVKTAASSTTVYPTISESMSLNAGQVVTIRCATNVTTPTFSDALSATLAIERIGN